MNDEEDLIALALMVNKNGGQPTAMAFSLERACSKCHRSVHLVLENGRAYITCMNCSIEFGGPECDQIINEHLKAFKT